MTRLCQHPICVESNKARTARYNYKELKPEYCREHKHCGFGQ